MHYTFEEYKLEVRSEADVIIGQVNGIQANPGGLLKTYPNPTSGLIRLGTDELGRLTIVDMAGRFVMQINTLEPFPSIDLGHLETGVYLISFETPSATYQSKLQKL
jgi:hypothetical protein